MRADTALVQIAPVGPGGVADHMDVLARGWQDLGFASERLRLEVRDVAARPLSARLFEAAAGRRRIAVLLHYSCYGYGRRGLCRWLIDALAEARRRLGDQLVLATMFHELHASGPPWRSAFWLGGIQAAIGRDLARACDLVWTNTEAHARWLRAQLAEGTAVQVAPVFSTIGESPGACPPAEREPLMVVFGAHGTRARALHALSGQGDVLAKLGVRQLVEIGSGAACEVSPGLPPCRHAGALPADQVNSALAAARYGLIDYPGTLLAKSSVYAACAAAGCAVLNTRPGASPADGLVPRMHYLTLQRGGAGCADSVDRIASAAQAWYRPHAASVQAQSHLQLLDDCFDARTESS